MSSSTSTSSSSTISRHWLAGTSSPGSSPMPFNSGRSCRYAAANRHSCERTVAAVAAAAGAGGGGRRRRRRRRVSARSAHAAARRGCCAAEDECNRPARVAMRLGQGRKAPEGTSSRAGWLHCLCNHSNSGKLIHPEFCVAPASRGSASIRSCQSASSSVLRTTPGWYHLPV